MPYNASRPLKRLQTSVSRAEVDEILDELWENLHHQGDVGLASYLSVPFLVEACISKLDLSWKFIGLVVLIENCRIKGGNPDLESRFDDQYFGSIVKFERYLLQNFKNISDPEAIQSSLALFATVNGLTGLGRIIEFFDQDTIDDFISQRL